MDSKKLIFIVVLSLVWVSDLSSQDIGAIIKSKPFDFKGRLSLGTSFSATNQSISRFSPFSYRIVGSPTVSIYGFDLPFTFAIYDSRFSYSKPTNRFGFNPKYKWVQLYFGENSYSMSPYVMSGVPVKGLGVKLTPGRFSITATRGTVQNIFPSSDTLIYAGFRLPTFERKVTAAEVTYNGSRFSCGLTAIKGIDNQEDEVLIPDSLKNQINPEENLAIGLKLDLALGRIIKLGVQGAGSILTNDLAANDAELDPFIQNIADRVLDPNRSTRFSWAGDAFLRLQLGSIMIGGKVKRVQPNYRTLGVYSVADDYQNYTLDTRFFLLKKKLSVSGSFGVQQNNLRNSRLTTSLRNIASATMSYFYSSAFSVTGSYSNFTQNQEAGIVEVNDSLRYGQVSSNLSISPRFSIKSGDNSHSISLTYLNFDLEDMSAFYDEPLQTENTNISGNYSYRIKESGLSIRGGVNYGSTESANINTSRYGGTVGISKKIKKKISARISNTFNIRNRDNNSDGWMNAIRLNVSTSINKKQRLSANLNHSLRNSERLGVVSTARGSINYTLRL